MNKENFDKEWQGFNRHLIFIGRRRRRGFSVVAGLSLADRVKVESMRLTAYHQRMEQGRSKRKK